MIREGSKCSVKIAALGLMPTRNSAITAVQANSPSKPNGFVIIADAHSRRSHDYRISHPCSHRWHDTNSGGCGKYAKRRAGRASHSNPRNIHKI